MRKILLILFVTFFLQPFMQPVDAHMSGQPPFFLINGKYSNLYPVPSTSLQDFNLPQDLAAENYPVNQKLDFEIEISFLQVPPEIVKKTTFTWNLGDGQKGEGLKVSHTYTKPGSYILTIDAKYEEITGSQLIQSVLINVLPSKDYELPKSAIRVDGKGSKDPIIDVLYFPFGSILEFDANSSEAKSSSIVSYAWDFGDGQSSSEAKTNHTYSKDLPQQQVFPLLRVKDANGFIADSFVQITNGQSKNKSDNIQAPKQNKFQNYLLVAIVLLLLIIGSVIIVKKWNK